MLEIILGILFFLLLMLAIILGLGLIVGLVIVAIEIISRLWPNYVVPWLDKHFGESGW